ncbi:uncharacterized protein K02A2.6-like [Leguminivora glycinivorella]|uniref:uncharacterized protein K02A2.6-like n=1 Tax=Leguminivora glycinivorella TaxID=1035111 RepID=UPI00200BC0C8|nr:uncharacterized protein K02A2.6-like [Leguminivora glycinivorella]
MTSPPPGRAEPAAPPAAASEGAGAARDAGPAEVLDVRADAVITSDAANSLSRKSKEFRKYLQSQGIRQVLSAPYHPATNGQAERTVQTVKAKLRKLTSGPWEARLAAVLYGLRTTPNSVNDKTPAELLNNRRFRTKFDKLNPLFSRCADTDEAVEKNSATKNREFQTGQSVYLKNYCGGPRWLKGMVEKRLGVCRYLVRWNDKLLVRHINQMLRCGEESRKKVPEATDGATDDDDEDTRISIPSPHRWADIIGVSGPQDIAIHRNSQNTASSSHKRARQTTPPESPDHKRIALGNSDSESELSQGRDVETEEE